MVYTLINFSVWLLISVFVCWKKKDILWLLFHKWFKVIPFVMYTLKMIHETWPLKHDLWNEMNWIKWTDLCRDLRSLSMDFFDFPSAIDLWKFNLWPLKQKNQSFTYIAKLNDLLLIHFSWFRWPLTFESSVQSTDICIELNIIYETSMYLFCYLNQATYIYVTLR